MIPKIIHFIWLSHKKQQVEANVYPPEIQRCFDSWRRMLPDYELRLWDFNRFPKDQSQWVSEAFDCHKYAFAADYIRCYALYHEGGIYMDMDVEVLKSFDPLLSLPYFQCFENGSGFLDVGVLATEPGNPVYRALLDHYDSIHFCRDDGTMDTTTLPRLLKETILSLGLEIKAVSDVDHFDPSPGVVSMLPYDYFSPIHNVDCRLMTTDRTMAIHHFAGSWVPWYQRMGRKCKKLIGPRITNILMKLKFK